ncbi:C-X-C chemokine receptor type 3 [Triplophysa tibetana]|uniref:C-X-C chemokine receptor type 3 n=1 Tax=Triplophysa tibetana TaxID=1572043 RepID=A0A5A9MZI8_9TELE|nr:C-X-C chemokine receptor type 3 [Triplophysa tibetana]
MELDLQGLFGQKNFSDYEDYVYTDEDHHSKNTCGFVSVFIPLVISLALLFGLLGNGLVLVTLWRKRRNFSVMDVFILHLGVVDVLLMVTLPFWAVDAVKGWIIGTELCKLTGAVFKINLHCGVFILALIGLESYQSIVHDIQMFSRENPMVIHRTCLIIWIISLLLSTPDWMYLKATEYPGSPQITFCDHIYPSDDLRVAIRLLLVVVGFILPALVLLVCCSCILLYMQNKSREPQMKKVKRTRVFGVVVLAFLISWTPYNISFVVDTVSAVTASKLCNGKLWTASGGTGIVGLLHCVIKPLIYFGLSKEFRHRAVAIVTFRGYETDSSDVSLWDCGEVGGSVQQEERSSLRPMTNGIKQTTETQDENI